MSQKKDSTMENTLMNTFSEEEDDMQTQDIN